MVGGGQPGAQMGGGPMQGGPMQGGGNGGGGGGNSGGNGSGGGGSAPQGFAAFQAQAAMMQRMAMGPQVRWEGGRLGLDQTLRSAACLLAAVH